MNVLVTGGAGYIGSIVSAALQKAGHLVVVYDNLERGHRSAIPPGAALVIGDTAERAKLEEVLNMYQIEAVFHFAAFIEAGESMHKPETYFRNNTVNTLNLLEAMRAQGVDRLVFSSTAAVYGNPERIPIVETDRLAPTNAYGTSKLMVEQMLAWFNQVHGLRYASLRYFNAAGAAPPFGEDHRPETHLIPIALEVALGKRSHLSIYGVDYPTFDGTCIRDYIHVSDLASAHLLALQGLEKHSKLIYNLGNGEGFSVREVIEAVRRVTGHPIPTAVTGRRPGDPAVLIASSGLIKAELGWAPVYRDLDEIIASAWEWRRQHPDGYAD